VRGGGGGVERKRRDMGGEEGIGGYGVRRVGEETVEEKRGGTEGGG